MRPVRRPNKLTNFICRLSRNVGASSSDPLQIFAWIALPILV